MVRSCSRTVAGSSHTLLLLSSLALADGAWVSSTPARMSSGATAVASASSHVQSRHSRSSKLRAVIAESPPVVETRSDTSADIGVLLLNLGGPDNLENVEPFLYNLFSDPEIITLPSFLTWMNGPLAFIIARTRAPQSREGYATIGGSSPQLETTLAQGHALEAALERKGVHAKTYVAMRYWHPFTEEALEAIKADGVQRLVVLPLYPQFSISTSGSSLRLLERVYYADQQLRQMRNVVIPAWYNRPGYVDALARLIRDKCDTFDQPTQPHIFFSAHGLPKNYVEDLGDPYRTQTEATVNSVMARLRADGYTNDFTLAYQSRVGPVEWLRPYTDDKIREVGSASSAKRAHAASNLWIT